MKNIAIIVPSLKGGGAERAASNITKNLSKEKYNIYLILFDSTSIQYEYDGKLIDISAKAKSNPLGKIVNFLKRYKSIIEIKKTYEIDTSISFMSGPNLLNILTRRKDKVILSIRANTARKPKTIYGTINRYLMRKLYNKSDIITVVSNAIKGDLVSNHKIDKNKIRTIYNSYELDNINRLSKKPIKEEYNSMFESRIIITVGRLSDVKGHYHLIRAFKKVNEFDKDVKLIILGEGTLRGFLQNLIEKLGLENNVFLLGFKSNPYKYIYNSYAFILPSLSEGFPNALAEAMACGVPVISADCKTGPREILAPGTDIEYQCLEKEYAQSGILIPVCNGNHYNYDDPLIKEEDIMADAILELLNNKELYKKYKIESTKRVKDFEIRQVIKEWEELI